VRDSALWSTTNLCTLPLTSTDIWRYIGCLLYIGEHGKKEFIEYWSLLHRLSRFLGKSRFKQIHYYLAIRDESISSRRDNEFFLWKLEPIASIIRRNYKRNWSPSSHLYIDEAMILFRGRSHYIVKLPNKPIAEGYKTWVLGDNAYVFD
jgi:Transposase IS4